ncbi:hypothetical protein AAF712_015106 [Marasmius tenuissimus]|uniref:Uncharacterized protein n=1 Tax=Marasmius tenuissimus TaxID=585030 RepID=A0ABR2ZA76_9AGAR
MRLVYSIHSSPNALRMTDSYGVTPRKRKRQLQNAAAHTTAKRVEQRVTIQQDLPADDTQIDPENNGYISSGKEDDKRLAQAQQRGDQFKAERDKSEKKHKYYHKKDAKGREEINELKAENKRLEGELKGKERVIKGKDKEIEKLGDRNQRMRGTLDNFHKHLNAARQKVHRAFNTAARKMV